VKGVYGVIKLDIIRSAALLCGGKLCRRCFEDYRLRGSVIE
jgi:hypothetical protein